MVPLLIAGTALNLYSNLSAASAEKKSANARAAALESQAKRRIDKGQQQAQSIKTQGQLDQTSLLARSLSSGVSREIMAQDLSMDELANRAKYEADLAIEDAAYESQSMIEDAGAMRSNASNQQKAAYLGAAGSILGAAYSYKTRAK